MPAPRPLDLSTPARALVGAGLGLVVGLLLLLVRTTTVAESIEAKLVDVRTRAFVGQRAPDPSIVLVTIEDDDVVDVRDNLSIVWPWEIELNDKIFRALFDAGAKAVAVDVLQLDRGQGADDFAARRPFTPEQEAMLQGETMQAEAFGSTLGTSKRAVLGLELHNAPKYEVPARVAVAKDRLGGGGITVPAEGMRRRGANLPVRRLAEGAAILGFVNVDPDVDEVTRRVHVVGAWGDRPVLSLPLATASLATAEKPRIDGGSLHLGDVVQRLDPDGTFLVNFRGEPRRAYRRIPASRVLQWAMEQESAKPPPGQKAEPPADAKAALAGKIVVWGIQLAGQKDVLASPLAGAYDGPELQATAIDNLLHGDGRVRAPRGTDAALLLLLCALVGAAGMSSRGRAIAVLAAVGAIVALGAVAWWLFSRGTVLDLATPSLGVLLAASASLVTRLLTEGRYNRWLEGAFGLYLAPVVIDALKKDPSMLDLGGVRREITILFSDIAGFSKFSRKLTPQQLVHLLNEYLTAHSDPVLAEGGVIDKFIGDAVMAFFGDPLPQPDHALRACRAALGVQAALPTLRPLWESLGLSTFEVRIGLNSGAAVLGNMGSRRRLSYTAMGDDVNLASRLESANKYFGSKILIGPRTFEGTKAEILARPIAHVVVVGWDQPEPVYELVAMRASAPADLVAHVDAYSRAQDAARAGDLDAADRALAEADRLRPGDAPTAWFREKVAAMRAGKEPSPWSGVVTLDAK